MIRLDKYLADAAGLTRSEAARMIRSGMAAVNGSVIRRPEQKFDENTAAVTLNGTPCSYRRFCYYLLDKPTGLITASRDSRQETVLDLFRRKSESGALPRWGGLTRIPAAFCC